MLSQGGNEQDSCQVTGGPVPTVLSPRMPVSREEGDAGRGLRVGGSSGDQLRCAGSGSEEAEVHCGLESRAVYDLCP